MSLGALDVRLIVDGTVVVIENMLQRRGEELAGNGCHVCAGYAASAARRIGWTERHRG